MDELLTAAQMREAERDAIETGQASGLDLMERAGRGIVASLLERRPDFAHAPGRALVLCGPGNNGGDGFVVARLLRDRGWEVALQLFGDPGRLPPDADANRRRWLRLGAVRPVDAAAAGPACDLLVDALFGTGLARPLPGELRGAIAALNRAGGAGFRVAVDCPSGLDLDSGRFLGATEEERLRADLTVTFGWRKLGHCIDEGPRWCGALAVAPLGLPGERAGAQPGQGARAVLLDGASGGWVAAQVAKSPERHKYGHGHALVLSGPARRTGAARLAARAALRAGAGLVTLGGAPDALDEHAAQVTAIMLREMADAAAVAAFLDAEKRITALCLGPALGLGRETCETVLAVLAARRPAVLDADALTAFGDDPAALLAALHPGCVLTPHDGEFARLFPDIAAKLSQPAEVGPAFSRADAACAAAARAGCVVLLKGPDTVIADPGGHVTVHAACRDRAAPWLATAGTGDVLAGLATGLLARGLAPHAAAAAAAWLHVESARRFGPGLVADDLPDMLPAVFRSLLA